MYHGFGGTKISSGWAILKHLLYYTLILYTNQTSGKKNVPCYISKFRSSNAPEVIKPSAQ